LNLEEFDMKLLTSKTVICSLATAISLVLFLSIPVAFSAGNGDMGEPSETPANVFVATFDGLDLKSRIIWIGDMVFRLDAKVKVKGTQKKLGLITDLKEGERIRATFRQNPSEPNIPYVTLIERL
jgi:hypothetical protein